MFYQRTVGGDYPHISYYDETNADLKYAYRDASGWHIQTVDSEGSVGTSTSLALGSGSVWLFFDKILRMGLIERLSVNCMPAEG